MDMEKIDEIWFVLVPLGIVLGVLVWVGRMLF